MSRTIYSSLDDAFQPLNPQEQSKFHQTRSAAVNQSQQQLQLWAPKDHDKEACSKDFSEIHKRMNSGFELPPYCAKEQNQFHEFQKKSNQDREEYLKNLGKTPRPQLSNDYQDDAFGASSRNAVALEDVQLGMYQLGNSARDQQSLVKVANGRDRAYLESRLNELEKELQKYQFLLRVFNQEDQLKVRRAIADRTGTGEPDESGQVTAEEMAKYMEGFSTMRPDSGMSDFSRSRASDPKDDIIDLVVLLGIGLLVIFILDSVFKMGKSVGAKSS